MKLREQEEYGLFSLICGRMVREILWNWTNNAILKNGGTKMTKTEWNACIGLELAIGLTKQNEITDYCSENSFLGEIDFPKVMGRNRFTDIRSRVAVSLPASTSEEKDRDPLRHLQTLFAATAVPFRASARDETSVRTTACTKSYRPSKPDQYAIRFYAVSSWFPLYIHTLWDNSSGLVYTLSPASVVYKPFQNFALHCTILRADLVLLYISRNLPVCGQRRLDIKHSAFGLQQEDD
ncbi:Hypothetical protein PHPALM_16808 [Phytophthora palmivora]|uniref:PiggyBac transposable element-derived protein domain-containing protein n=1 Tax=Phytophthora palmivora TaxID=4796 RepID=A0A2P4XNW0_9STRA|nr:Hypothetical protein PHPALM_16808 [Phytophthora palmivora]